VKADMKMNYETGFAREGVHMEPLVDHAEKSRRNKIWIVAGLLLALGALVIAFTMFGRGTEKPGTVGADGKAVSVAGSKDTKEAPSVTVIVPGRQLVENIITATGTLAARRDMPVGAVGEGGLVRSVLVDAGSWVGKGQILAVVDRQVQAEQSNQLVAQISASRAEADLAQAEYNRASALLSRGFISKADIQRKAATRDAAFARVRVAQAQLAENRARIGRLDIRAPEAGLVLVRSIEAGQVVGAGGAVLFRIAKGGELELRAQLSEVDLANTSVGQRAEVAPVGTAQTFGGHVWQIAPVIDPQSRQGVAKVALAYNQALRPGGFATARINSGTIEAPLLPESAVQSDAKGNYVYIAGSGNKVERRDVKVGSMNENGVSILSGLSGTERVVMSAGGFLNPGETVRPNLAKSVR
jgi:HlyD family secretion protein